MQQSTAMAYLGYFFLKKILLAPNVPKWYYLPVDKMINERTTTIII